MSFWSSINNQMQVNEWLERLEMKTVNNYQGLMLGRPPVIHHYLAFELGLEVQMCREE